MKLWLVCRSETIDYDEPVCFVIRAETESDARRIASANAGYSHEDAFKDSGRSYCTEIIVDGDEGVILDSRSSA